MSWALLGAGAWAAIAVWRRDGLRAAIVVAALAGLAMAALQGALAAGYGYDPIGTLRATEQVYRDSLARVAALRVLGAWIAPCLGGDARPRDHRGRVRGGLQRWAPAVALVAIVAVAALGASPRPRPSASGSSWRRWPAWLRPPRARWRTTPLLAACSCRRWHLLRTHEHRLVRDRMRIGIITGSGTYALPGFEGEAQEVATPVRRRSDLHRAVRRGRRGARLAAPRRARATLSSAVTHQANISALRDAGVDAIVPPPCAAPWIRRSPWAR